MSKIITQEEFEKVAKKNNPYVKIVGKYSKMKDPIECQCNICGVNYYALPENIKAGKMHRKCSFEIGTKKRTKTHEEFVQELFSVNPNIQVLGLYQNAKTNLLCKCLMHNTEFYGMPTHLLNGKSGCQFCIQQKMFDKLGLTHEQFINKLKYTNNTIQVKGIYIGSKKPIHVECTICNYNWNPIAGSLLSGFGCPHCQGRNKTTIEFKEEIKKINPTIEILGEYTKSHDKILCKCSICGKYMMKISGNLRYSGCPYCNMSHGEKEISDYLSKHNICFESQKTYDGLTGLKNGNLSYDFYLPMYNLLIEYQGEFHDGTAYQQTEEDFLIQQEHDRRKKEHAQNNNIKLLEIWYWDYDNIPQILERNIC